MTVSELRKALKGVNGKLEVFTRDHDHNTFETGGLVRSAKVIDQKEMDDWERKRLDPIFIKNKKYFIVSL